MRDARPCQPVARILGDGQLVIAQGLRNGVRLKPRPLVAALQVQLVGLGVLRLAAVDRGRDFG